ncbi:acyltransferase family protein [Aliikangiella maris]|uniref:Acyltransferase family protein n=2 Tax=Aliikangiella maris TaxID=3162458 RepID=A0ABV3MMJ1_9GAMM
MTQLKYRIDIQGLRAVAVILVLLSHIKIPLFSGGFIGVDIFFVISGYLISGLLLKEYSEKKTINLSNFYFRRLKRLLPALFAMLIGTLLIASILLSSVQLGEQTKSLIYASTWTSNLFFTFAEKNYFGQQQQLDLYLHTWSLGVEEQFYLIWPIFILIIAYFYSTNLKAFTLILLISLVTSFSLSIYWLNQDSQWSFYLMPARVWQFSLGALVYLWHSIKISSTEPTLKLISFLSIVGCIVIISCSIILDDQTVYPGYWAILPSISTALILANRTENILYRLFVSSPLVWIGNRSYSLYLWHWPLLTICFSLGFTGKDIIPAVILTIIFAAISYRYIEKPIWKGNIFNMPAKLGVSISILSILIFTYGLHKYIELAANNQHHQSIQMFSNAKADVPIIYNLHCDSWYKSAKLEPCIFGNPTASKTVVIFGDSIMAQWFSFFLAYFDNEQWRIIVLTKSSCPIIDIEFYYTMIGKNYTVCTTWRNQAIDYLQQIRPEFIFVGSAMSYSFSEEQWVKGSKSILTQLSELSKQVVVFKSTPNLSFYPISCLTRQVESISYRIFASGAECQEKINLQKLEQITNYIQTAIKDLKNVQLLDLNDIVCPQKICRARTPNGEIVFRDNQHITNSFVESQFDLIVKEIDKIVR